MTPAFSPGFRFSALDAVVLALGAVATVSLALVDFWISIAVGVVVAHFFLFCNIVRLSRSLELIWAGIFTLLCILATIDLMAWPLVFLFSGMMTVIVIVIEMRRPSYHGVAWRILNPHLPQWWRSRTESSHDEEVPASPPPSGSKKGQKRGQVSFLEKKGSGFFSGRNRF